MKRPNDGAPGPWAKALATTLDSEAARQKEIRRRAAQRRRDRARALDTAHVETMARYGRPFERLFCTKP